MKSLFSIHAGEYLVGSHIEKSYPKWNVWIPSKDTGIDLLVTNLTFSQTFTKKFWLGNQSDLPELEAFNQAIFWVIPGDFPVFACLIHPQLSDNGST